MSAFAESTVEQAALAWFESLGYAAQAGPDIAPGGSTPGSAAPMGLMASRLGNPGNPGTASSPGA